MANHNHSLRRLMSVLMLALVTLLIGAASTAGAQDRPTEIPEAYTLAGENDQFQLYVDSTVLAFKLVDRRSGYIWHSGIDAPLEDDRLNTSWKAFARSGLSIEYFDDRAANKRVSIDNADHTIDVTPIDQGISARVTFTEFGITVGMDVQLEAEGVRVEVPFDSIAESNPDFRLAKVYLYPFLGATRGGSVPGYMFVPDGTGSLIRFAETTKAQNMFYGRYYGADLGMSTALAFDEFRTNPSPISFPVFGIVHGDEEHAFLSVVEEGAEYGEVQVHPSGIITNFNFLYNAFIYSQTYFQATNRSGAGVTIVQREPNTFNAVVHFRFLTGDSANYTGMARSYQQYLVDHGMLHRVESTNPNIGVRLEFLGGDKEKVLLWWRFVPMTTVSQMRDILDGLQLPNADVIYYGWQPYGAYTLPSRSVEVDGTLGSVDALRAVADQVAASGGQFSLYIDPQSAVWDDNGATPTVGRNELAVSITNITMEGGSRSYGFLFTTDAQRERYLPLIQDAAARLGAGIALDGIGSNLYSDFSEGHPVSRAETRQVYQTLLADATYPVGLYRPNDYMWRTARAYYEMPIGDNGYIYTTEAVPFLPIVLSGYLPYYGTMLNFSPNPQDDLLRHVEYGMYPSYFVTHEPTANMLYTRSSWIYSSSYDQWGETIRTQYAWLNALLAPVRGQQITAHEQLEEGVFATTYANGMQIIVNYTESPFAQDGVTVEANDALLLENGL